MAYEETYLLSFPAIGSHELMKQNLYIYCEGTKHMHMVISLYRSVMETEDPHADNVIDV